MVGHMPSRTLVKAVFALGSLLLASFATAQTPQNAGNPIQIAQQL